MNQQREQEALLAAQREQELCEQEQAAQEKEEPPQSFDFHQLIGEICSTKVCEEQKQNMEDTTIELVENFRVIYKMNSISNTSRISSVIAIAPDLSTKEPEYSLSIGDERLSTIPETKLDEVIKSSVKNLVPIPSEFEVTSDNESECDVPVNDESSQIFTTFPNLLFDCNDDFTSSDDKSL
nr:hypothetical protein [Tanacetum cinerariifolium]